MAKGLLSVLRTGLSTKAYTGGGTTLRPTGWGGIRESFAGAWQSGVEVDPVGSLTANGSVFACVTRIANDIAKLDLELKYEVGGICVDAPKSSPYWNVLKRPNQYQNSIQFITWWLISKLLHGNAFFLKGRDGRTMVNALYPLNPKLVTPLVATNGDVYYSIGSDPLARLEENITVPASEIIHDRMNTLWHPLMGVSPLHAAGVSATMGKKIQNNSSVFFNNMSRPSGILTAPGSIQDETAARLKAEWERNYSAENIGRLAVLGDGLKYEPMTIPAQTAQLIEQLNWSTNDVARPFGMPLYKIGGGASPAAGSIEAMEIAYYNDCLQIHIESIEKCLTEGLELDRGNTGVQGYEVEICLDGLLRMDSAARNEMLVRASGGAYMKPNEARQKMNLPPAVGGDELYKQHQDYSLSALAKRDALADPFSAGRASAAPSAAVEPDPAPDNSAAQQAAEDAGAAATAAAKSAQEAVSLVQVIAKQMQTDASNCLADAKQMQTDASEAARKTVQELLAELPGIVAKALPAPVEVKAEPADEGAAFMRAAMAQARKALFSHAN